MERYAEERHVNVGAGHDMTIAELAGTIREVVDFGGRLVFDRSKPDGAPRKLLDVTRLTRLGWQAKVELRTGLADTYRWFLDHRGPPARCRGAGFHSAMRRRRESAGAGRRTRRPGCAGRKSVRPVTGILSAPEE